MWQYYQCGGRRSKSCDLPSFRKDELEKRVITFVLEHILTPDILIPRLEAMLGQREVEMAQLVKQYDAVQRHVITLNQSIAQLLNVLESQPSTALAERIQHREVEKLALAAQLHDLETQLVNVRDKSPISEIDWQKLLPAFRTALSTADSAVQRDLLYKLISRIDVDADKIVIYATIPLAPVDLELVGGSLGALTHSKSTTLNFAIKTDFP